MGKKEKEKKKQRSTRLAQREHRGAFGQPPRSGLSEREQMAMVEELERTLSSPAALDESMDTLARLFQEEEELTGFRFPEEALMDSVARYVAAREEVATGEADEEAIVDLMAEVLPDLVTEELEDNLRSAVGRCMRNYSRKSPEGRALRLARILLEPMDAEIGPEGNPVWAVVFDLSMQELLSRLELEEAEPEAEEVEVGELLEGLDDRLSSEVVVAELERLLEENPELEGHPGFDREAAEDVLGLAWDGKLGFFFDFPDLLQLPLALVELAEEREEEAEEAWAEPAEEEEETWEEQVVDQLKECLADDLTDEMEAQFEQWLAAEVSGPTDAGRRELLAAAQTLNRMFVAEDNPLYLALYYASFFQAWENPPQEFAEEIKEIVSAPEEEETYFEYGEALREAGQSAPAIRAFERGLELNEEHYAGHRGLAYCYRDLGDLEKARQAMETALQKAASQALEQDLAGEKAETDLTGATDTFLEEEEAEADPIEEMEAFLEELDELEEQAEG